jgi:anaerobic selenocysteine-containing dehydrogenase
LDQKDRKVNLKRVSWDYALKLITKNLNENIKKYGPDSIQPYSYSGTLGMLGYWGMSEEFWNKVGAARLGQNDMYCSSIDCRDIYLWSRVWSCN